MSQYKVESRYDGPASDVNAPIIETTLKSLEKFFFFISNNRNPPITDKIVGPLKPVRVGVNCISHTSYVQLFCHFIDLENVSTFQ